MCMSSTRVALHIPCRRARNQRNGLDASSVSSMSSVSSVSSTPCTIDRRVFPLVTGNWRSFCIPRSHRSDLTSIG